VKNLILLLGLAIFSAGCGADEGDCVPGLHVPEKLQVIVMGPEGRICDATVSAFENEGEDGQPIATTRFELTPEETDTGCLYSGSPAFDAVQLTILASSPAVGQDSVTTFWSGTCSAPTTRTLTIQLD
jgi:hypothetical protein